MESKNVLFCYSYFASCSVYAIRLCWFESFIIIIMYNYDVIFLQI